MNLVYPILRPSIPWGASLLRVLDPDHSSLNVPTPDGVAELTVAVEWGPSCHVARKLNQNTVCTLTVRALSVVGREPTQICCAQALYGDPFSVTWAIEEPAPQVAVSLHSILEVAQTKKGIECDVLKATQCGVQKSDSKSRQWKILVAPEYIVDLTWHDNALRLGGISDVDTVAVVPQSRCLHLIPPIHSDAFCETYLADIVAGGECNFAKNIGTDPAFCQNDSEVKLTESIRSITMDSLDGTTEGASRNLERGFGLEVEFLTFCADPDVTGCFTKKQEVQKLMTHLMAEEIPQLATSTNQKATSDHATFVARRQQLLARCLKWELIKEIQMEPFVEHVAKQTYARKRRICTSLCEGGCACAEENKRMRALLGLELDENDASSGVSLFQAEFKSPAPPHELSFGRHPANNTAENEASILTGRVLIHEGEQDSTVNGDAEAEVKIVFAILKHIGAAMPPLTRLGHSSAGLHVHVNVCCPSALGTPLSAKQILSVFLAWVRFEPLTRRFCKPWKWRDRSSGSLWPTGPEFQFDETVWAQGTLASDREGTPCRYDLPAFFRAAHGVLAVAEALGLSEAECEAALMREVLLEPTLLMRTLGRHCSLNLASLAVHGTVEFRRMDATLDAEWVLEWARFCVGFVEAFKDYERFGRPFLGAPTADIGLERLRQVQESCMMPHSDIEAQGTEAAR